MSDLELLASEDPQFAGTWHPFPPPDKGIYDLRQAVHGPDNDPRQYFFFFPDKRVYEGGNKRLMVMNRRVTRMRPEQGWQFRFHPQLEQGKLFKYRPYAVIYAAQGLDRPPLVVRRDDVSQQLPVAVSREEALYIVRSMPERWPIFRQIHIEYTPEAVP